MLDLRRLTVLKSFASCGSITATAAELGYSASAISQQLSTLEREAGVALVDRTAYSATLTDAGQELVRHADVILAAVEAAESSLRARKGTVAGRVDVSCIPGLAAGLAPHLALLQRDHPALSVVAHETDSNRASAAVLDRTTDVAVIDDWTEEPIPQAAALTVQRVHREQVVLAVPAGHPLARDARPLSGARLRATTESETWLCTPAGPQHLSRAAGDVRLAEIGASPGRRWEFEGLHVLARLVSRGAGVALLPTSLADDEPGVVGLQLRPRMYRYLHVLTRSTRQVDPAIAACVRAVRQALAPDSAR